MSTIKQLKSVGRRRPPAAGRGRKKGELNRTTVAVKEAMLMAFEGAGGVPGLTDWAKANRADFYRLWVKLLPRDVNMTASVDQKLIEALMELADE